MGWIWGIVLMSDLSEQPVNLSLQQQEKLLSELDVQNRKSNNSQVDLGIHVQVNALNEFPLSLAQQKLWLMDQLMPDSPIYNVPVAFRIWGQLQVDVLETAVSVIVARHASLRTIFISHNGDPVQRILPSMRDIWSIIDFTNLAEDEREDVLLSCVEEEAKRPFNLSSGPLFRATVVKFAAEDHLLMLTLHHIIADHASLEILLSEVGLFYQQTLVGEPIEPPELLIQYKDYAVWERNRYEDNSLEPHMTYWENRFDDEVPVLELPVDRQRPSIQTHEGASASFVLAPSLSENLKKLGQEEEVSLFIILLCAYNVLLARHSGQEDIVVGVAMVNRNQVTLEKVIGYFANMVPVRMDLTANPTFEDLIQRVRREIVGAFAQDVLSFNKVAERFSGQHEDARLPIFQTSFVFQDEPLQLTILGLETTVVPQHNGRSKLDLSLEMWAENGRLQGHFEYNTELFDADTITKMIDRFQYLLQSIIENTMTPIQYIPMLTDTERTTLLEEWNNNRDRSIPEACLHWRFEEQVAKLPHALAVQCIDQRLSYQELNDKANQLANYLQTLGAGPGHIVGISMQRAPELLIAMWGILKSGAAYVPIDSNYPFARIQYMLADAHITALLTQESLLHNLPQIDVPTLCLDTQWGEVAKMPTTPIVVETTPDDPAYIIYTSGSTGKPKGVIVCHKSVVNYADTRRLTYEVTPEDRFLQFASISFDIAVEEVYTTHLTGAALILRTEAMVDMHELLQRCHEWEITLVHLSAAYWHELVLALERGVGTLPPSLRMMIVGGDKVLPERVATWLQLTGASPRLMQSYGPTEVTVNATTLEMSHMEVAEGVLPDITLGWPIRNMQAYILNKYQEPVPVGVLGELYLGGIQVAQGYLNRPELTADCFVKIPWLNNVADRLYKTGDLVKHRSDGRIEFIGRMDFQLKIRGYRVEPSEIQMILNQISSVQESLVIAADDKFGMKQLIAYCVPIAGETLTSAELNGHLKESLPEYMIPSSFVILEAFPITQNGKINRQALPKPTEEDRVALSAYLAPRTPTEEILVGIWTDVLQIGKVGVHDNFFDLGGHSLLAVRLFVQIDQVCKQRLALPIMFEAPTIAQLALILDRNREGEANTNNLDLSQPWLKRVVSVQPNGEKPPFFHMGGAVILRQLSKYLGDDQPVYGILEQTLEEGAPLRTSVEAIVVDCVQAIQSIQPEGPYMLGGLCFGGIVALETARALQAQGHEIALVTLIETYTSAAIRPIAEKKGIGNIILRVKYHWNKGMEDGFGGVALYFWQKINKNLRKTHKKIMQKLYVVTGQPMLRQPQNIYETNVAAGEQYVPSIFSGRATLFQASERPDWFEYDPTMGWDTYFTDGIEVYMVSGDHLSIYDEPNVQEFGEKLKYCIEKAQLKYQLKVIA